MVNTGILSKKTTKQVRNSTVINKKLKNNKITGTGRRNVERFAYRDDLKRDDSESHKKSKVARNRGKNQSEIIRFSSPRLASNEHQPIGQKNPLNSLYNAMFLRPTEINILISILGSFFYGGKQ